MKVLDVGCGTAKVNGAIGIDRVNLPGVDVVYDLNKFPWPFDSESFDAIYMNDIIEHLTDTIRVMEECYRLLKSGGRVYIRVVYWNHKYAFSDPTHVNFFSDISFEFFTGKRRSYYTKARFKLEKLEYIYDWRAKKLLRSKELMNLLSHFLCNIKEKMEVTMVKE